MQDDAWQPKQAVSGYFGDLIDEVARTTSVSHRRLVEALSAVQAAFHTHPGIFADQARIVYEGPSETVFAVPTDRWAEVVADIEPSERQAVRTCHRRMAVAFAVCLRGHEEPLVVERHDRRGFFTA